MNRLCQITGVSRAGYYRFRGRHESKPASMTLRNQIQHIALRWPAYGYRRVHAELVRRGWKVNHKRILQAVRRKGFCDAGLLGSLPAGEPHSIGADGDVGAHSFYGARKQEGGGPHPAKVDAQSFQQLGA